MNLRTDTPEVAPRRSSRTLALVLLVVLILAGVALALVFGPRVPLLLDALR